MSHLYVVGGALARDCGVMLGDVRVHVWFRGVDSWHTSAHGWVGNRIFARFHATQESTQERIISLQGDTDIVPVPCNNKMQSNKWNTIRNQSVFVNLRSAVEQVCFCLPTILFY